MIASVSERWPTHQARVIHETEDVAFSALDPFFDVVQRGLSGLVDGEHYFDTIATNRSRRPQTPAPTPSYIGKYS